MSALPRSGLLDHLDDLKKWCRRRSRDKHFADDVVQEVLLAALQHLPTLRDPDCLRGWLFRVAQRRLADERRRLRSERLCPLTAEPPARATARRPVDRGRALELRRALRRLPPFLRQPVRLHYLKGQPLCDVAASLQTTVSGVKARLYRARRMLREGAAR